MPSDKSVGGILLLIGVVGIVVYGYLLFLADSAISLLILKLTAFFAVAMILAIVAWIGYTMATTPPPEPIDVSETTTTTPVEETSHSNIESKSESKRESKTAKK